MKKIVFDLDGTLIDSIADITKACNVALHQLGFASVAQEAVLKTVGYGLAHSLTQFLPSDLAQEMADQAVKLAENYYSNFPIQGSSVFSGVLEMLETLVEKGHELSILSNKNQDLVEKIAKHFFPTIPWSHIIGIEDADLKKPNPTCLLQIISASLQSSKDIEEAQLQSYMVGDHNADALLAKNSSVSFIGAGWGYYSIDDSVANSVDSFRLAHTPHDLLTLI